jgi:LysM repeat protein
MPRLLRLIVSTAISLLLPLLFVSAASADIRHTVVAGDTLSYLAQVYSTTVGDIVIVNKITNPNLIFPGQELIFPGSDDKPQSPAPAVDGTGDSYTIQPGDTLSWIANHFGVPMDAIQQANGIDNPGLIIAGHTLTIPRPAPAATPAPLPKLQFPPKPYDPDTEAIIDEMAAAYGVSPGLVKAVATIESGWNQGAVSSTGARGVMQLMPGTAQWLEDEVFHYPLNEDTSAYDNIKMGTQYLAILIQFTGGDEHLAVASYYQGLAPTQAGVFYPDTTDYVDMIFRVRDTYWPG